MRPRLSPAQQRVVDALQKGGYAIEVMTGEFTLTDFGVATETLAYDDVMELLAKCALKWSNGGNGCRLAPEWRAE